MTRRDVRFGRFKRHSLLNTNLFEKLEDDYIQKLSRRNKRDTLAHVENVMEDVEHQIHGLKVCILKLLIILTV